MHSTHFIYGYMASDIMVMDHSDSEKGNPLLPHRLLLSISSKGSFICTIPDRITYTTAFVTPVVEHWLEREIAQWVHPMKDRSEDPLHHECPRTSRLWKLLVELNTPLPASAACERLFSAAGLIFKRLWVCIGDANVEAQLLLKLNKDFAAWV